MSPQNESTPSPALATPRFRAGAPWAVFGFALMVLLADQWTKNLAIDRLASPVHPMVVAADGTQSVRQLFAGRGVADGELAAAIGQRLLWRYDRVTDLSRATRLDGPTAPRQLLALAGTGFPAPRRLRVTLADTERTVGELAGERWRVEGAALDAVLRDHTYRAGDLIQAATRVPPAGSQIALMARQIVVIDGFMTLVYAENPGAAWGVMRELDASIRVAFFTLIGLLAALGMIWAIWTGWLGSRLSSWALAGVLGGAVGNLIDRNLHTIVVDFILNFVGERRWPVYNVADIGISVGVAIILIELLVRRPTTTAPTTTAPTTTAPTTTAPTTTAPTTASPPS